MTSFEAAQRAHDSIDQKRKYTGAPYWVHVQEVADIIHKAGVSNPDWIAAAHLHDVLEDVAPEKPEYGPHWIEANFGHTVLTIVKGLTDIEWPKEFNRATRKTLQAGVFYQLGDTAQGAAIHTIKVADLISNTSSIVELAKTDFARIYIQEKSVLLKVLYAAPESLLVRARKQIEEAQVALSKLP